MHKFLIDLLVCPICHHDLDWKIEKEDDIHLTAGKAACRECKAVYPLWDGIGIFLTPDLPREDLWRQAGSRLVRYLREHPDIERRLMATPLEMLSPTDQFFRGEILEARQEFAKAKLVHDIAMRNLYHTEYLSCWQSQVEHVIQELVNTSGPVIDLASGKGYLAVEIALRTGRLVVPTDFSPTVLRRNRAWLKVFGLGDQVSLLAFDARRAPFRNGAIEMLTTNLGLPNIQNPGELMKELRRIVSGRFLAISIFYPPDDEDNASKLREAGLGDLLFRQPAINTFNSAGWEVALDNLKHGKALPTPPSRLLEGARIDAFPVTETVLEWCVLDAH